MCLDPFALPHTGQPSKPMRGLTGLPDRSTLAVCWSWHSLQRLSSGELLNFIQSPRCGSTWWTTFAGLTMPNCRHFWQSGWSFNCLSRSIRHCRELYIHCHGGFFTAKPMPKHRTPWSSVPIARHLLRKARTEFAAFVVHRFYRLWVTTDRFVCVFRHTRQRLPHWRAIPAYCGGLNFLHRM